MIGRLFCRVFGHPERARWMLTDCDGVVIVEMCWRCGRTVAAAAT